MKKIDNENIKKVNKKIGKNVSEFKEFIMKGNILDMAVGVIIGGAFGKIITSLVDDILMPLIGMALGGVDFSKLSINLMDAKIMYGSFIQQVIDFLIIAICMFIFVKIISKMIARFNKEEEEAPADSVKSEELKVLEEIRDELKRKK